MPSPFSETTDAGAPPVPEPPTQPEPDTADRATVAPEPRTPIEIRVADTLLDPARTPAVPDDPLPAVWATVRTRRRRYAGVVAAIIAVVVLITGVPAFVTWLNATPAVSTSAPTAAGLLPWPARGDRVNDTAAINDALRMWRRRDDGTPPADDVHLVYAGATSLGTVIALQGLDADGRPVLGIARYSTGGAIMHGDFHIPSATEPAILLPAGLTSSQLLLSPPLSDPRLRVLLQAGTSDPVDQTVTVDKTGRTPSFGLFATRGAFQVVRPTNGTFPQIANGMIERGNAFPIH